MLACPGRPSLRDAVKEGREVMEMEGRPGGSRRTVLGHARHTS